MQFKDYLRSRTVYLDGGMGTMLQAAGLAPGQAPAKWSLTHPDEVKAVHRAYYEAGSNLVCTNTFGVDRLHFRGDSLAEHIRASIDLVRAAREESVGAQPKFISLDIGPTGKLLEPFGDLSFEEAVEVFAETVRIGAAYGVDCVTIETMTDCAETKAALLAVKENCSLPVIVTNAYGEYGKMMTGADPAVMVAMLEGMGADAVGVNCSFGPKSLRPVVEQYLHYASVPVVCKPNAGMPRDEGGKMVYDLTADEFADDMADFARMGVRALGGCCGTTPEHIARMTALCASVPPQPITQKKRTVVSSYSKAVVFGEKPVLIGERINPTGKKKFKEALRAGDMDYIVNEGLDEADAGADVLDVNVGMPEIDEVQWLTDTVAALQELTDAPLQLDTSNFEAMESAARRYIGKPMLNSVSGTESSMEHVFPIAAKYGGLVVALTLDGAGIPDTAEGRVAIAMRIASRAAQYGIGAEDLIFDPLAMAVSADPTAALETLRSVKLLRDLGYNVSLGVSNVSFGLPERDGINASFFTSALESGLKAAIMNPFSTEMMRAYRAFCALHDMDPQCADYIAFAKENPSVSAAPKAGPASAAGSGSTLRTAIIRGQSSEAAALTLKALESASPLDVINNEIAPALDEVGRSFEAKTVFLPQLLMSAEAAKAAFESVRKSLPKQDPSVSKNEGKVVILATVHGDIHDIGKNIVRLLLENYGFDVRDLGRDVPPETIVAETLRTHAPVVGLSALMTTTVPAMEETIRQLRASAPFAKIVVGGAVLTEEYAAKIGADAYAKDAMATVRFCEEN